MTEEVKAVQGFEAQAPAGDPNLPSDPNPPPNPLPTYTLNPPTITQPNNGISTTSAIVMAGTVDVPGLVTIYDGDMIIGACPATTSFWYMPLVDLKKGKHTFTANLTTMGSTSAFAQSVVVTVLAS